MTLHGATDFSCLFWKDCHCLVSYFSKCLVHFRLLHGLTILIIFQEEEYFYYSIVNVQDFSSDAADTPLGPSKEGPLMFKFKDSETRWATAYFILKYG